MNVFGECPIKGSAIVVEKGPMAGETFVVEDWARNPMKEHFDWPSDIQNPAVLMFWANHQELLKDVQANKIEYIRVAITALYGHVGWAGCIAMPDELGIEVG